MHLLSSSLGVQKYENTVLVRPCSLPKPWRENSSLPLSQRQVAPAITGLVWIAASLHSAWPSSYGLLCLCLLSSWKDTSDGICRAYIICKGCISKFTFWNFRWLWVWGMLFNYCTFPIKNRGGNSLAAQ